MKKSILIAIMMMAFMITGCSSEDYYVEENDEKTVVESSEVEEQESYKELYLKKLAELDEETDKVYGDETLAMMELNLSMGDLAQKWDDMLNEIYGVLNDQLSASEIDELDQEAWLKYRDEEAEKARAEYEGGTIAPTMYNDTKIYYTKERCYLLVNDYMK